MKATEWFAIASAAGAFCGRVRETEATVGEVVTEFAPQVVDVWNAATRRFDQVWSDTGLPYNPKSHGGR